MFFFFSMEKIFKRFSHTLYIEKWFDQKQNTLCKMKRLFFCKNAVITKSQNPYIAVLLIQFAYAGMALFSKAAVAKGMNPFVFVVYRQAFATIALSPFAFFLERLLEIFLLLFILQPFSHSEARLLIIVHNLQPEDFTFIIPLTLQDLLGFINWVYELISFNLIF